ncbi:MAG TPA: hypothetical protein VJL59_25785 [Anaerolineales bacterium]|nr:hypothetical protein [Anaerolineales bacterium]
MSLLCSISNRPDVDRLALTIRQRVVSPTAGFLRSSPDHDPPFSFH